MANDKTKLNPIPRLGLIHDISAKLYNTFESQIREAVSNALDADSSKVSISANLDGSPGSILISDNGKGLNKDELLYELLAIGGSAKINEPLFIGHIGIGFYALTSSCKYLEIYSKKKGSSEVTAAKIDCEFIHDRKNSRIEMTKANIGKWLEATKNDDRFDEQYTFIKLIEPYSTVVSIFTEPKLYKEFIRQLRKILPIKYNKKSKIFKQKPDLFEKIKELKLKFLEVEINGENIDRLLYGDEHGQELNGRIEIIDVERDGLSFCGFTYINTQKIEPEDWYGFILRLNNVAIGQPTFLDYSGKGIKQRGIRIAGDIHLLNFPKEVVLIGRETFDTKLKEYNALQNFVYGLIDKAIGQINDTYGSIKEISQVLKAPEKISNSINKSSSIIEEIPLFKEPGAISKEMILKDKKSFTLKDIVKELSINIKYLEDKTSIPRKKKFSVRYIGKKKINTQAILYQKELLDKPINIKVGKKSYEIEFKKSKVKNIPIEIDYQQNRVYLNLTADIFKKSDFLNAKLITSLFWIRYIYDNTKDKEQLYQGLLNILKKII